MDLIGGLILLVLLAIPMAVIAVWIKFDSKGPVFIDRNELLYMENTLRFTNFVQW